MNNKQEVLDQIKELKIKITELEATVNKPDVMVVEKWEPIGDYFVNSVGYAQRSIGSPSKGDVFSLFGNYFKNKELAEKAAIAMRKHNRLLAYVLEHAPDYEPDWENVHEDKYYVFFNYDTQRWNYSTMSYCENSCVVYMPRNVVLRLVIDLNSGRVVL